MTTPRCPPPRRRSGPSRRIPAYSIRGPSRAGRVPPTDSRPPPSNPLELEHKSRGRAVKDVVARIVMWGAFALAMVPLVWILCTVLINGGSLPPE